jgi:predicted transcriptional regulator
MNRIEISVLSPQAALQAFADTWQQAEAGEESKHRLAFGSLRELFSAITEKRLELLRHVASNEGLNVRQLAQALGRDYKNVHTDVSELVGLGLLERDDKGLLIAPYDAILIHAGIRDAA